MAVGVAGLAFRGGAEHGGDVVKAFDVGLLREIEVTPIGLALTGKSVLQILCGLAALQGRHLSLLLVVPSMRRAQVL